MYLATYNPARSLNNLFSEVLGAPWTADYEKKNLPFAYVQENKGEYSVEVELPGVRKEDISVDMDNGVLSVKALRKRGEEEIHYERHFRLADEVDTSRIVATHENGVLKLTIGRKPEATPQRIEIQ